MRTGIGGAAFTGLGRARIAGGAPRRCTGHGSRTGSGQPVDGCPSTATPTTAAVRRRWGHGWAAGPAVARPQRGPLRTDDPREGDLRTAWAVFTLSAPVAATRTPVPNCRTTRSEGIPANDGDDPGIWRLAGELRPRRDRSTTSRRAGQPWPTRPRGPPGRDRGSAAEHVAHLPRRPHLDTGASLATVSRLGAGHEGVSCSSELSRAAAPVVGHGGRKPGRVGSSNVTWCRWSCRALASAERRPCGRAAVRRAAALTSGGADERRR